MKSTEMQSNDWNVWLTATKTCIKIHQRLENAPKNNIISKDNLHNEKLIIKTVNESKDSRPFCNG